MKKIFNRFGGVSAFLIYRETQESRYSADTTFLLTCKLQLVVQESRICI